MCADAGSLGGNPEKKTRGLGSEWKPPPDRGDVRRKAANMGRWPRPTSSPNTAEHPRTSRHVHLDRRAYFAKTLTCPANKEKPRRGSLEDRWGGGEPGGAAEGGSAGTTCTDDLSPAITLFG